MASKPCERKRRFGRRGINSRSSISSRKPSGRRKSRTAGHLHYDLEPAIQPNLDLLKAEAEELRKRWPGLARAALSEHRQGQAGAESQGKRRRKKSKLPKKDTPSGTPAGPDVCAAAT